MRGDSPNNPPGLGYQKGKDFWLSNYFFKHEGWNAFSFNGSSGIFSQISLHNRAKIYAHGWGHVSWWSMLGDYRQIYSAADDDGEAEWTCSKSGEIKLTKSTFGGLDKSKYVNVEARLEDVTYRKTAQPSRNGADNAVEGKVAVEIKLDIDMEISLDGNLTIDFGHEVSGGGSIGVSVGTYTVKRSYRFGFECYCADEEN